MSSSEQYTRMQREHYEDPSISSEDIVGNYAWHEAFPYETLLLHEHGDLRHPVVAERDRRRALDFGCGPGRMIPRMSRLFGQVDGVDISARLLADARTLVPAQTELWQTNGRDLGGAPVGAYDFVYCTVSLHHIPVWEIRMEILRHIWGSLRVGGCVTLQLCFHPNYPWLPVAGHRSWADSPGSQTPLRSALAGRLRRLGLHTLTVDGRIRGVFRGHETEGLQLFRQDAQHASWRENRYDASGTNAVCDATISTETLPLVRQDFTAVFGNFSCWWYDVSMVFEDLRGESHGPGSWHSHWIFLHARKEAP